MSSEADRASKAMAAYFQELWMDNALANLPNILRWPSVRSPRLTVYHLNHKDVLRKAPAVQWRGPKAFAGVPMVIVCPGPSLLTNIRLLEQVKGKAIIVTFAHVLDSASRPLTSS